VSDRESNQASKVQSSSGFRKTNAQPTNWLMPVMLVTLRQWNSYGYELMKHATTLGCEATNPGSFYRTLRQMEEKGMVKSSWEANENNGGPARRMYSITDVGEAYLDFWAKGLEQYQQMLDAFFGLYTGKPLQTEEKKDDKKSSRDST
jgi:PadR family transcriptional regulator PadR